MRRKHYTVRQRLAIEGNRDKGFDGGCANAQIVLRIARRQPQVASEPDDQVRLSVDRPLNPNQQIAKTRLGVAGLSDLRFDYGGSASREGIHAPTIGAISGKPVSRIDLPTIGSGRNRRVDYRQAHGNIQSIGQSVSQKRNVLGKPHVHPQVEARRRRRQCAGAGARQDRGRLAPGVENAQPIERGAIILGEVKVLIGETDIEMTLSDGFGAFRENGAERTALGQVGAGNRILPFDNSGSRRRQRNDRQRRSNAGIQGVAHLHEVLVGSVVACGGHGGTEVRTAQDGRFRSFREDTRNGTRWHGG